uniref:DUF2238 domain-containing protein n=1 Tax=Parerythrobacter lutipelagi TaxID=1964208 RepID=UPI0010FA606E|nr:DUF2238 domain-containing protein [Parerythrobacter lutipelagi]
MTRGRLTAGQIRILIAAALFAAASIWNSPYPALTPLQTIPTFVTLAMLAFAGHRWGVSTASLACLCLFLALHTIGGRYIYSFVPYDAWIASLGLTTPSELFGWERNHYDRLVHFAFGLLWFPVLRELLNRIGGLSPRWSIYVAVEAVLAASAAYEIFEWWLTLVMAPGNADAYNGQQGDMWDAQRDMALAFGGALIAAAIAVLAGKRART